MARRAVVEVLAVAASACAPLRLEPTNAGFGNAFQALFEGFKRAARCGATLQLVDGANRKEKSRYRRICDRLTYAAARGHTHVARRRSRAPRIDSSVGTDTSARIICREAAPGAPLRTLIR